MNQEVEKPATYGLAPVRILYTNHRGDTRIREIAPQRMWLGVSPWHEGTQYFLTALDIEKKEVRDFALTGIKAWMDDIR